MANIEHEFPFGAKVWHRSFRREAHVVGWAEQRGRDLLIVRIITPGYGISEQDAEWTANSCKLLESKCGASTYMRLLTLTAKHRNQLPDFAFQINPLSVLPVVNPEIKRVEPVKTQAQVNHAAKATKPDMDMLMQFPKALALVSEVLGWADKEKGYGFQEFLSLQPSELRAALLRHTFQTGKDGKDVDDESKKLHAVHALANALMYVEALAQ